MLSRVRRSPTLSCMRLLSRAMVPYLVLDESVESCEMVPYLVLDESVESCETVTYLVLDESVESCNGPLPCPG